MADAAVAALVADDSATLWQLLPVGTSGTAAVVGDNAGRELIPDLVLINHLLAHGHAERVVLHVKPYPYYVSDAMTADVVDCLRRLPEAPGETGRIGGRLWKAMAAGSLEVRTHPFFCAPLPYEEMPEDMRKEFADAELTILKGRYGGKTTTHDLAQARAIVEIQKQAKQIGVSLQIVMNMHIAGANSKDCMYPGRQPGADCSYGRLRNPAPGKISRAASLYMIRRLLSGRLAPE